MTETSHVPQETAGADSALTQAPGAARRILGMVLGRRHTPITEQAPIDALEEIDRSIPGVLDDFSPDGTGHYRRPKVLQVEAVRRNMQTTFQGYPDRHEELVAATNELFGGLVIEPGRDSLHLTQIERLLIGYPDNIVASLGDKVSADSLLAVIRSGTVLLEMSKKSNDSAHRVPLMHSEKGAVAALLTQEIPQLVAAEGIECLKRIEAIAAERGILRVGKYVEFRLKYRDGMPELGLRPEMIVGDRAPDSPFTREDADNAWQPETHMGVERRQGTWGDLAQMAAITDRWNREYGLVISLGADGTTQLAFIRGDDAAVKNKTSLESSKSTVFFHSHPQQATAEGVLAPLISHGDIVATQASDSGGGYYNIVCKNGITLQVGSQPIEADTPRGWTVESGDLQGATISPDGGTEAGDTIEVMRRLLSAQGPFSYSINTSGITRSSREPRKITFMHLPWNYLNVHGASLHEVCFGGGLRHILPTEAGKSDVNLNVAIQKAKYGD